MAEFTISSFRFGLDTRKDVITSQPGTLVTCENAHVNPGGEIEKRKAFVSFATVSVLDSNGAQGTFGLEVTDAGLVVFGSALNFGASVTQGQPTLASALTNVTYQQLKHPTLTNDSGETYNATYHRLTAIIQSGNFNGKAFAIAKFSDNNRFLYYDGALVQQSANGMVMALRTDIADLSTDLVRQLLAIGWNGTANINESAASESGSTLTESPPSDYFTPVPADTSTLGQVGHRTLLLDGTATAGVKALASFQITANGDFLIEAPNQSTATTPTTILTGHTIVAAGTSALTAAKIVAGINDLTTVHGYSAIANGDNVHVYAPLNYDIAVAFVLTVTGSSGGTAGAATNSPGLNAVINPDPLNVDVTVTPGGGTVLMGGQATVIPTGLNTLGAGYTYLWSEATPGSGVGFDTLVGFTTATCTFKANVIIDGDSVTGRFKCLVTDVTTLLTATAYVTVSFNAESP